MESQNLCKHLAQLLVPKEREKTIETLVKLGAISQDSAEKYDREGKLEIHILGNTSLRYDHPRLIFHGKYARNDFANHVKRIQPHVGAIFSICNETWCHTLTELWSVGVPAIVLNFPTVARRVLDSGAGWVYDHRDIDILYRNIVCEVYDAKNLSEKRLAVIKWQENEGKLNTNYKMSLEYEKVYYMAIDRCAVHSRSLLVKTDC